MEMKPRCEHGCGSGAANSPGFSSAGAQRGLPGQTGAAGFHAGNACLVFVYLNLSLSFLPPLSVLFLFSELIELGTGL